MVMRVRDEGPGVQPFDRMEPKFELYDRSKLGVHRTQEPVLKTRAGLLFLEDLVLFNDKPTMIAARRDTINGKVELFWQYLDPNLTRLHPPFEQVCTFDARVTGTGEVIPIVVQLIRPAAVVVKVRDPKSLVFNKMRKE